ncbi:RecF/RecN/SMC protein [Amniculicola lignicola CBS 123094]|uniref:Structural maintenance of chromosomes protein n=1 Tax=Amniculicola lignicola CBS 123094 TaxID=1392246 RepID=A0A6A5WY23_9PLEO|nr:RecF/RecN/SMC protein [Amniculicola lignicola CBS 123094]
MSYIKQITIQGFKSYKEQTPIEAFSPRSNVIVGKNGTGKSNFFAAVRFVLGDEYTNMSRESRQGLLHEGSGSAVMSAYVEVTFDNTGDRFHTGKPEFVLRRTIGLKKDEYSVDKKNATKVEVNQILESAGFSRANPYYIVPQGRVTALTTMGDAQRLGVLKEISGSIVYETRRADSLRLLADTDTKRAKIDETVQVLEERLHELQQDRDDLEQFQSRDREKRCLLYALKWREEDGYKAKIEEIDNIRANGAADVEQFSNEFIENENQIQQIDAEINRIQGEVNLLRQERTQLEVDRRDTAKSKAGTELELAGLTDGQSTAKAARKRHETEVKNLRQQIADRKEELNQIMPSFQSKKAEEQDIWSRLQEAEGQRKRLEDKQGRSAVYSNKKERDQALRREVDQVNLAMATRKAVLMATNEELVQIRDKVNTLETEITELNSQIENQSDNTMDFATKLQEARDAKDRLQDDKKKLNRDEMTLTLQLTNAQRDLNNAERQLSQSMDHNTGRGLETLRRYKNDPRFAGVYGTISDLIKIKPGYEQAVETTGGASLFHLVVDNDDTASAVVQLLYDTRGGRLTCVPLNRVSNHVIKVPSGRGDTQHLLEKLEYEKKFEKAIQHYFGKAVICSSLAICASVSKEFGVDALTPGGDRADKRGRMFGGYADPEKSKLRNAQKVKALRTTYEELKDRMADIKGQQEQLDQQITAALGDVRKVERERTQVENSYLPMRNNLRAKQTDLQGMRNTLEVKERAVTKMESALSEFTNQLTELEAEVASKFEKALSRDEEQLLNDLAGTVRDLRRQLSTLMAERSQLESRKVELEGELQENLQPNLDRLLAQEIGVSGTANQSARLKECERSLKSLTRTLEGIDEKIIEVDGQIDGCNAQPADLERSRANKQQTNQQLALKIEKFKHRMDKSMTDKGLAEAKLAEIRKEIRDLGTLPDEAWQKYAKMSPERAEKQLAKVNEQLKKFINVNRKAVEQYEQFTKQRRQLSERRAELDTSRTSIEEMINILDHRKDEAIQRTFKQVSRAFQDVFQQLVPAGMGSLVIQTKSGKEAARIEDSDDDEEGAPKKKSLIESYSGVAIRVSFNSKHDEQQYIGQLSGGQKSLCALALIFAIQQCDPAPFYLFDEIDANLDPQYRTAVAAMLKKISGQGGEDGSGGGQFICTTFRPEMVMVVDKCYGVSYSNKTSTVDTVSREQALEFISGA